MRERIIEVFLNSNHFFVNSHVFLREGHECYRQKSNTYIINVYEELGGIHSGATWIDTTVLLKPGKYRLKEQRAVDTGFKESKSSMVKGQVFLILSVRFEVKWEGKRHKTDGFCKKTVNSKWLNGKIFVPLHPL